MSSQLSRQDSQRYSPSSRTRSVEYSPQLEHSPPYAMRSSSSSLGISLDASSFLSRSDSTRISISSGDQRRISLDVMIPASELFFRTAIRLMLLFAMILIASVRPVPGVT